MTGVTELPMDPYSPTDDSKPDLYQTNTQPQLWTRQDYLLTILAVLIKFGDGVEIYLPGVITQIVSCELGVSNIEEGILAVILYLCWSFAVMMSVPISKRFGDKFTLLLSLYLSIGFAVLCAMVPNYYTLLLSRALTGICGGLNASTIGIILAKRLSSKKVLNLSSFLQSGLAMPVGGAWVSILGWLLLDRLNWRIFVLLTSVPLFVPPIIIIHSCIIEKPEDDEQEKGESGVKNNTFITETDELLNKKPQNVPNFIARVIKSSLFAFSNVFLGYGSIILLPWLLRSYKESYLFDKERKNCEEVVQGNDFLILAAVTGATNVVGRPLGYFLWNRVSFLILQSTLAVMMAVSYGIILINPGLISSVVLLGIAKLSYSIQGVEISILYSDYNYFGMSKLGFGASVTITSAMIGATLGTSTAAFLNPYNAVIVSSVIACTGLIVICFMKERF